MKDNTKSSPSQIRLHQSSPKIEWRAPSYMANFQPFSLELMSYTSHIRAIALTLFILGVLAISSALSLELWQLNQDIAKENALLELAQGGLLLLAAFIQGWRAFSAHHRGLARDIRIGLGLFAFALFLREVDIDKLGSSEYWSLLEKFLRAAAALMMLGFILHMSRNLRPVLNHLRQILLAPTVLLTLLAMPVYACGWPFDRELFNIDRGLSLWFEETFELNACLLLFCASLMANINTSSIKDHARQP